MSDVVRVRLDLGYDGGAFAGWAAQPGQRTVEDTLAEALARVLRLPVPPRLVVAGRTDAGVHATGQVVHLDVPAEAWAAVPGRSDRPSAAALRTRLTGVLPVDLRVSEVALAPPGFDARFSALRRHYAYRICDHPSGVPPLRRHDVVRHKGHLDEAAMNQASATLLGLHNFAAFCKRRDGATTVRTLLTYRWRRDEFGFVVAEVVADAFCRSMVRALVGAVIPVGAGRRPQAWPVEVLVAAVRNPNLTVAQPHGLVLEQVDYPDDDGLAARAIESRAVRTLEA